MKKIYFQRMWRGWEIGFFGCTLDFRNWIILIIPFFLIGCATVKKSTTETEIKTDSIPTKITAQLLKK